MSTQPALEKIDRQIINMLQGGFPISDEPYKEVASWLSISQDELIARLRAMVESGTISRFGPLFNSERLGGAVTLAAIAVPEDRYDEVTRLVNAHPQVAHNYQRTHKLNMWFVISTEKPEQIAEVIADIETETGLTVINVPKQKEYFIGLRLEA